jgi:formylglycine-generating enzyme required for sulfatase activity
MSGNVWEWCWDRLDSYDYPAGALTDYAGPELGSDRVLRGGAWNNNAFNCAVAYRDYYGPYGRNYGIGFRVVAP